ncbi:MAG: hypothetical protein RLY31_1673 [Bacteroidota bacterium]|jgi:1-acyl-sn-glycerol-3-phosphate acyltransferase
MRIIRTALLSLIYFLFKWLVRLTLRWFYSRTTVVGTAAGTHSADPPCIVVTNHPSTLLDPLNTAVRLDFPVHFLANASLFRNRFANWFFNTFFCIPIERYQDTGGRPLNNTASFRRAIEHLARKGSLYIAPEGTSYIDRRLRKIKTGTARIALEAEQSAQFGLGLTILPIGLNYTDPTAFRSEVLLVFGSPIPVGEYRDLETQDPIAAVQALTDRIRDSLASLMIDTHDEAEEKQLSILESLLPTVSGKRTYERWQAIRRCLGMLRDESGELVRSVAAYEAALSEAGLRAKEVGLATGKQDGWWMGFLGFLSIPGYVLHAPPAWAAYELDRRLNDDIHWRPTYRFLGGLITYPVWLTILGIGLHPFGGIPGLLAMVMLAYPLGLAAEAHRKRWKRRQAVRQEQVYKERHPTGHGRMMATREVLQRVMSAHGLI